MTIYCVSCSVWGPFASALRYCRRCLKWKKEVLGSPNFTNFPENELTTLRAFFSLCSLLCFGQLFPFFPPLPTCFLPISLLFFSRLPFPPLYLSLPLFPLDVGAHKYS